MARKTRRSRTRTRTVTVRRVVKKTRKSSKGTSFFNRPSVQGFGYGVIRRPVNDVTKNLVGKIPVIGNLAGSIGDEAFLWTAATVLSMNSKGSVKRFAKTAQSIESSRIGEQVNIGGFGSLFGTASSTSTSSDNSGMKTTF